MNINSILIWINSFGFCQKDHIQKKFSLSLKETDAIIHNLTQEDLVIAEKIFTDLPECYRVTKNGVIQSKDLLPAIKKIPISTYRHNLKVIDVSLHFVNNDTSYNFNSERLIRHKRGLKGVGQKGHICDGELVLDTKKIALEIELSSKGTKRRKEIISHYIRNIEYDEMWYLYDNIRVYREIAPLTERLNFIKLVDLKNIA